MINDRQKQLLTFIIEHFIESAEPVGSKLLSQKREITVSAPTLRNEMRALENAGYLTHPHTSAGRIPTEAGYKHYVGNLTKLSINKKIKELISELLKLEDQRKAIKQIAKHIAEHTQNAVFVSFGRDSVYYTGISQLFAQPEFKNYAHTVNVSEIFDTYEERVDDLLERIDQSPKVLIGEQNPFGSACALVTTKFGDNNIFSIMGPIRMNYKQNMGLITYLNKLLS